MPFHGVLPERRALFRPEPAGDVGVSDAAAWRLNPAHRYLYDKLRLALAQGLPAAPCGVDPLAMGLPPEAELIVKPITNLAGMSLNVEFARANALPERAGSFWCQRLRGEQSSTDCLVRNGETLWQGHTLASPERDRERPLYWRLGADLREREPVVAAFVIRFLHGYTGMCNLEMIDGRVIEAHLRGSNGFFDRYPAGFVAAWAELADHGTWQGLPPLGRGFVYSLFGDGELPPEAEQIAAAAGLTLNRDRHTPDRLGILYGGDLDVIQAAAAELISNLTY